MKNGRNYLPTSTGWILFMSSIANAHRGYNSSKTDSNQSTSNTLRTQVPDFVGEVTCEISVNFYFFGVSSLVLVDGCIH